jgi:hypothetical protein
MTTDAGVPISEPDADTDVAEGVTPPTPTPATPDAAEPPPSTPAPDAAAPPSSPPVTAVVLRVRDIQATTVTARVVFAHRIEARRTVFGAVLDPLPDAVLKRLAGEQDLRGLDIRADTIYAHDLKVESIEALEVHAREIRALPAGE